MTLQTQKPAQPMSAAEHSRLDSSSSGHSLDGSGQVVNSDIHMGDDTSYRPLTDALRLWYNGYGGCLPRLLELMTSLELAVPLIYLSGLSKNQIAANQPHCHFVWRGRISNILHCGQCHWVGI